MCRIPLSLVVLPVFMLVGGCAIGPTFTLSPQAQVAAEDWAISAGHIDAVSGRPRPDAPSAPTSEWTPARCRWTWTVDVAVCDTRSRLHGQGPWRDARRRFKLRADEVWELLVP